MSLSLVTPSLNQLGFLRQCVECVRQLAPAVEHVVADGASTDGTIEFLERERVATGDRLCFRSAPDRGLYDALNLGFALTSGELLGYLNCDDLLLPWTAGAVSAVFERQPEVDLVYGDAIEWEPATDRCSLVVQPPPALLGRYLECGGHLAQPAVFFRRRLFERLGGFDRRYRLLGDHELWLRALHAGARCAKIWEFVAVQRMVPGQLMQRLAADVETERAAIHRQLGLATPSARDRRHVARLYALLHRLAIAALALPPRVAIGVAGIGWPWQQTARSAVLEFVPAGAWRSALAGSTRGVRYLRPTTAGRALFPAATGPVSA